MLNKMDFETFVGTQDQVFVLVKTSQTARATGLTVSNTFAYTGQFERVEQEEVKKKRGSALYSAYPLDALNYIAYHTVRYEGKKVETSIFRVYLPIHQEGTVLTAMDVTRDLPVDFVKELEQKNMPDMDALNETVEW